MHSFFTTTTTLALATFLTGAAANYKDGNCEVGFPGPTRIWHANTNEDYHGGNFDLCWCIDQLVNIAFCKVSYQYPDGKSAYGSVVYCTEGVTKLNAICGGHPDGSPGPGWIMSG